MNQDTIKKLNKLATDEAVVYGKVTKVGRRSNGDAYMEVHLPVSMAIRDANIVITESEAFDETEHGSLVRFIGRTLPFILLRVDDDEAFGSRKAALSVVKAQMLQELQDGKVFTGEILALTPYGAYVEVNGISGLLRTSDATTDHSELSEHFHVGDSIQVKCRTLDNEGRINWTCDKKLARKEPLKLDFAEDTVVSGVVTSIKTFGNGGLGVFCHISTGVDALCSMPEFEVFRGQEVAVKILRIIPNTKNPTAAPHVRGRIVRVL